MNRPRLRSQPRSQLRSQLTAGCLLGIIVMLAAGLRLSHADWDGGYQLHPDERAILFIAQDIHLPHTPGDALDAARSPLNPYRNADGSERLFAYGSLPLYLGIAVERLIGAICRPAGCGGIPPDTFAGRITNSGGLPAFDHLTNVGRAMSALFDTLSVLAVYALAWETSGRRVTGLLASALLAVTVLHIQNAHFGTVDTSLAFFCTLSLWLIVRWARTGRAGDSILAGAAAGLAAGSKVTGLLLLAPIVVAHLQLETGERLPRLRSPRTFWPSLAALIAAFIATNPYALLDAGGFASSTGLQLSMAAGANEPQFVLQYSGTWPVLYALDQLARWGFGLPMALAACAGIGWGARHAVRERSRPMLIAISWVVVAGLALSSANAKFPRYLMPVTPALIALATGAITMPHRMTAAWRAALGSVVLVVSAANAVAFFNTYQSAHPWVAASRWIYQNIPAGSRLVDEAGDDALPLDLAGRDGYRVRDQVYRAAQIDPMAEPDDCAKITGIAQTVAGADYVIIASSRLYGVAARLHERFPLTASYYKNLMLGEMGFALVRSWYRYPNLFGWSIVDDPIGGIGPSEIPGRESPRVGLNIGAADESFIVYDHPLVLLFQNQLRLSAREIGERITGSSACP